MKRTSGRGPGGTGRFPQLPGAKLLFEEVARAGAEHLDPDYVRAYDSKAAFDPAEDLELLTEQGLSSGSTLVDLGCGTGALAAAVAPLCRRLVAVDISPPMLDAVRARIDGSGLDNVECVQAGLLTYEHKGDPPDFVYSRNAMHHLPDMWKAVALQRMAAMLRPGGVLLLRDIVFSCEPRELDEVVGAWLDRAPTDPARGWTRSELEQHLSEEYSTFTWLLEPMLERAGFGIVKSDFRASTYALYLCSTSGSG